MSQNSFFYCASCRLKVLIIPLGEVRTAYFSQCLQLLRENPTISLGELDHQRLSKSMFNPSTFPQGQLLFEYLTDWDSQYTYLEDFQHWRKLFAIIALKDVQCKNTDEAQMLGLESIKAKYKSTLIIRTLGLLDFQDCRNTVKLFLRDMSIQLMLAVSDMVNLLMPRLVTDMEQAQAIQALPTLRSPTEPSSAPSGATTDSLHELKRPASVGPGGLQRTPSSSSIKPVNRNSITSSQNPSSENLVEKRGTSKGRGRVLKALGDLSLLCGLLPGAITLYTQSVEILRLTTDYLWHASALEGVGMAMLLLAYLKVEYSVPGILQPHISTASHLEPGKSASRSDVQSTNDFATDTFPAQSLPDVLNEMHTQILNLYQRSMAITSGDPVPPICYSDHIVRFAQLLCDIYVTGGLDDVALQANVLGIRTKQITSASTVYPPRGEIARWVMKAWGPHLDHVSVPEPYRIHVIAALMSVMSVIGFRRKRAALLTELLRLFVPKLVQARVVGASESGLHPNVAQGFVQQAKDDGGLIDLMASLIKAYGSDIVLDENSMNGWPSLRVRILKECIAFCEALPHPTGVARFTSLLFTLAGDRISKEEQIHFAANLTHVVGSSKKRGEIIEADYWDAFVVENVEIAKGTGSELQLSTTLIDHEENQNGQGPFLYNARAEKPVFQDKTIWLVQDEEINVRITLRNNFYFDLEVMSLSLWTKGVLIDMELSSFILPAQASYTHSAFFIPREPGHLEIKGCKIKFSACKLRHFPIRRERNRREKEVWYDMQGGEIKVRRFGDHTSDKNAKTDVSQVSKNGVAPDTFWLEKRVDVTVLPLQPILILESSSLRDACMTLLEGETISLMLRLRNLSRSPVNHLDIKFDDPTSTALEEALTSTLVAEDEASELEFFLYERPAFVWSTWQTNHLIIQNETLDVRLLVNGKRGLTHGVVYIYYASIDRLSQDTGYYYRRVEFNLAITVNASLELVTCDFLPLREASGIVEKTRSGKTIVRDGNKFLAILEFRNSWIKPLNLELSMTESHESSRLISLLLQSNQIRRVVVTLRKILVPSSKSENPIPRKTKSHQFVISESTLKNNIAITRQAWWYRKHILDRLSGKWVEQGPTPRNGDIELRGIRLSEGHIQAVQGHEVEVLITVLPLGRGRNHVHRLDVSVQNHQDLELIFCLHLMLVPNESFDPSKSVCFEGLEKSPILTAAPHGSITWSTEITLLAVGYFGLGAVVEERPKGVNTGKKWTSNVYYVKSR